MDLCSEIVPVILITLSSFPKVISCHGLLFQDHSEAPTVVGSRKWALIPGQVNMSPFLLGEGK
jgi:hypothetical protein